MTTALPLGLRNRNVGNMRPSVPPWQGEIGENGGFAVFDTLRNGIRAMARQLIVYQDRYGLDTVRGIINRWAPSSENDTSSYVTWVCTVLQLGPDEHFNVRSFDALFWLITAMGEMEQGHDAFTAYVSDADIDAGISMALMA